MRILNSSYLLGVLTFLFSFNLNAQIITTVAGSYTGEYATGYSGDGGPATSAGLTTIGGIALDSAGNIYLTDCYYNIVRKVNTNGIITTIAGNGYTDGRGGGSFSGDGGLATSAGLSNPQGIAVDATGNIYIADALNDRIRKVNTSGIISTVAGNGVFGYNGDGGLATNAELSEPYGVALDAKGNIYIAERFGNRIRKVNTNGIISTLAGNGYKDANGNGGSAGDGGPAISAELDQPAGVAVDAIGNIYISNVGDDEIRKVDTSGIISKVLNGFNSWGVAVDAAGNVYAPSLLLNGIQKVDTGGIISIVAGNGYNWFSGDGGPAINAGIPNPQWVAVDAAGNIYVSDESSGFNTIRKIIKAGNLPVTLASFTAIANNKTIQTNWHTSTELNTSHFIIQHSTDGSSFTDIGTVKAMGSGANGYQFTDNNPTSGINYYRLKSVDKDGSFAYSKVVSVQFTENSNQLTVFPNPSKSSITISGNHIVSIQVVDNMGKIIKTQALKDATNPSLSISGLSAGIYHLHVQTTDGKVSIGGIVKE